MPHEKYLLAADLGGTKLAVALMTLRGRIVTRRTEAVDTSSTHAPLRQICAIADALRAERAGARIVSVGVAVPGLVRKNGTVWAPNLPGWTAVPLARLLSRKWRVPVCVESDRNAAVLGEAWRGVARGKADVVVLMLGTGIGAAILSGGQLVRGAHELSGCAGWLASGDAQTAAARRCGQLESLAAGPAIARRAGQPSAEAAAAAAKRGNRAARRAFREAGTQLGKAVANLISLFDPEVIVLTGGLMRASRLFMGELRRAALLHAQPLAARQVKIVAGRLGADANLYGVARLAGQQPAAARGR